jgi:tetrameric-type glycyl-tRNA synthetase beta subunit
VTRRNSSSPDAAGRSPLLLEIGSEEIPARFVSASRHELAASATALFAELQLVHGEVATFATPRRLALRVADLATRQPDRELELKGPPAAIAFDAAGEPTQAALGFARKAGVPLAACERASDARGEHLLARRVEAGRPAREVLAERLPELILGLRFPKVMRWGRGSIEYPRPLQWVLALLGGEVVPFTLGELISGRTTRTHRTLAGDARIEIARPGDYEEELARHGVVVDPERRAEIVRSGAVQAAGGLGGIWREDDELLEEIVYLCEHPTVFAGRFTETFFELPSEVIVTALKEHQRYFAVNRPDGAGLLPYFLSVRDGGREHLNNVVAGNERVLRARLDDALFYWRFDQKRSPVEHAARLETVTWLQGFGSLADKSRRLVPLARAVWRAGIDGGGLIPGALERAAQLCKFDLVTEMIRDGKEFTKLEGVIGARYAAAAGEAPEVCKAIEEHYAPRGATDELPQSPVGAALAVADRLDTLAGCWLAGFAPSGTKDPYALRRHALAVLRIVLARGARLDLDRLLDTALAAFPSASGAAGHAEARAELREFVRTRLAGYLVDSAGCDPDVVRAVLPVRGDDPTGALVWIRALAAFRDQPDFRLLATGFKRCRNILQREVLPPEERPAARARWERGGVGAGGEALSALAEPAETALRDAVLATLPALAAAEAADDATEVYRLLAGFGPAIDRFFDEVRVNVEDAAVRSLRHAFLREIDALFASYADFAALAPAD